MIPVATEFESWGVETLRAQGGQGMRAGQWCGRAGKVGSSGERDGRDVGMDQILMAELSRKLRET